MLLRKTQSIQVDYQYIFWFRVQEKVSSGKKKGKSLSRVQLFVTLWTAARQVPQSMEFSRQEYWRAQPFPSLRNLSNPGIEPRFPALQADLPPESQGSPTQHDAHIHGKLPQSCPTLCDPVDCSPPGSSVHGIFQARVLEWVAMPSSTGPS